MVYVKVNLGVDQGIMSNQLRPESRQERFIRHERGSKQASKRTTDPQVNDHPPSRKYKLTTFFFFPIARYLHPWQEEG